MEETTTKLNGELLEQIINNIYLAIEKKDRIRVDVFVSENDLDKYPHLESLAFQLIQEIETHYTEKFVYMLECFFKAKKEGLSYEHIVSDIGYIIGDKNLRKILIELKLIYYLTQD